MISRAARAAPTQTIGPEPSASLVPLTRSSSLAVESPDALGEADAEADALAFAFFSAAFADALADALGLFGAVVVDDAFGLAAGLGASAGGGVYGLTPGAVRELDVWNLNATQPPVGTLRLDAPELAYVQPPPLPFDQNSAQ